MSEAAGSRPPSAAARQAPPSIAILGSARRDGNTAELLRRLVSGLACEIVDLQATPPAPFSYGQRYPGDPFFSIVERMTVAPVTIFATPVYWFSYSAIMKGFIDRFSDLSISGENQELGRKLRGRFFALLASGSDPALEPALNLAFTEFCHFLGARYLAPVYAREAGPFVDAAAASNVRHLMGEGAA